MGALWPDGRMDPLPASVSRYTFVLQPGIGSQIILWGGRENSEGVRPDGSRDSIATRRIWQPSSPDASTIYESWGGWLGEMVACSSSRYLLRIWPHSKQEFICLNSEGKTLWEHKLTLSCYFWPPPPLCALTGPCTSWTPFKVQTDRRTTWCCDVSLSPGRPPGS